MNNKSHLSSKDKKDFNILYLSDKPGSDRINCIKYFNVFDLRSFQEFKIQFNFSDIILIDINDQEYYKNVASYIDNHKFNQKIITTINKNDTHKVYLSIESRIRDFIFLPMEEEHLQSKLNKYYRENNFVKNIYKMKTMEENDVNNIRQEFYKEDFDFLAERYVEYSSIVNNVTNDEKYDNIRGELKLYLSLALSQSSQERHYYLEDFSSMILYILKEDRPEDTLLRNLTSEITNEMKEVYEKEPWIDEYLEKLIWFFEIELRFIGVKLKYKIQTMYRLKTKNIQKNSLHLLMSSSSDILNNHLNKVDAKSIMIKKYFNSLKDENYLLKKREKLIDMIERKGTPIDEFKDFLKKQSKLFKAFKESDSSMYNMDDLIFLLDFVFVNGIKVKNTNVDVILKNNTMNTEEYKINENVLVDVIYIIIENAIEAKAKNIFITLTEDKKNIKINIKNDGEKILKENKDLLFQKFFTTKNNNIHSGIGLSLAKTMLSQIYCEINFNKRNNNFIISILKRN